MIQLESVNRPKSLRRIGSPAPNAPWLLAALLCVACSARTPASTPTGDSSATANRTASIQTAGIQRADGTEVPNLADVKAEILEFHESGEWESQVDEVSARARARLDEELETATRPAIVLDIDDTALSTFAVQRSLGFGWVPDEWDEWVRTANAPAHRGVLELYRHAIRNGVAVFFVTGRREHLRASTERQLRDAGYGRWVKLHMKPDDYDKSSVIPYKVAERRSIEEQGFEILVNVGDQWSDLDGGRARATFKLPNPVYHRP